ncbi:MAG TPA: DUF885 family protein, partial [Caulobacteraceae bacterium]|nr:DUF885 family protein [Caulobacteraceae bacterium]
AADPAGDLHALISDVDAFQKSLDPVEAGRAGDRAALVRWPDDSAAAEADETHALQAFKTRLAAIPAEGLGDEDALNRSVLDYLITDELEALSFDPSRMAFSSDNLPFDTPDYAARGTVIRSRADADAWIQRLQALPAWFDREMANARRGIATGFVQPRPIVESVIAQTRPVAEAEAAASPLLTPFQTLPAAIPTADQAALKAQALQIVWDQIKPKERAYLAMLQTEYLPHAATSLALRDLPDGERYYAWLARHYTTTELTPDEIHALGEKEVVRIRAEMDAVIKETGFKGSFAQFLAFLRTDPRFYAKSREELLEKAAAIDKRVDAVLPAYFGTLPRLTFGVLPVPPEMEEGYTTGRYWEGSPEQGIAAGYMVNTSHLDQRPLYELPALTLHESVPGHHLQIALSQELKLPWFRRNADLDAFVEGWALYAEDLGVEMRIYRDPYERFGKLSYEMWRACRLVADTGIHWLRWSREQARACFVDNTALAPKNIDVELDRYISWPGQALAYKVGELAFKRLRQKAEIGLGPAFDLRKFHDELLLSGALPLGILEQRVDWWIAAQETAAQQTVQAKTSGSHQ